MAEKLCTLRTKGGGGGAKQTETVLWTNPNPTSSSGFAAQTVTLSDSISNYDYIYVTYGFNHSYTGITSKTHYLVSEFKNLTLGGNTRHFIGQGGAQDASNNTYTREIYYISDTSIGFTTGYGVNKALSAADVLIPTSIIGIKNMGGNGAINLSGFTFQFKAHTNNASGNNRTYINLPVGHINSFRITGISGSYSAMRFGWKGDNSAATDVVLNTVYTKPSDATELAIWVAVLNSTCTVTMEIID